MPISIPNSLSILHPNLHFLWRGLTFFFLLLYLHSSVLPFLSVLLSSSFFLLFSTSFQISLIFLSASFFPCFSEIPQFLCHFCIHLYYLVPYNYSYFLSLISSYSTPSPSSVSSFSRGKRSGSVPPSLTFLQPPFSNSYRYSSSFFLSTNSSVTSLSYIIIPFPLSSCSSSSIL